MSVSYMDTLVGLECFNLCLCVCVCVCSSRIRYPIPLGKNVKTLELLGLA